MRLIDGRLRRFFRNEGGATSIEYAMIASGIAIAIAAAVTGLGASVETMYQNVTDGFK